MPGAQTDQPGLGGGTLTANGQNVDHVGNANYNMVNIRLTLTGWQGAILAESSIDGTNFETLALLYADTGATNGTLLYGTLTHGAPTTSVIRLIGLIRGGALIRVRSTSFTAGTMAVDTKATIGDPGLLTPGIGGMPVQLMGSPACITRVDSYTSAQTDTAIVTAASGTIIVVLALGFRCGKANTLNTTVRVGFGAANTPALGSVGIIDAHPGIDPGGGTNAPGQGIIDVGTDGQDLRITCTDPGGAIYVTTKYLALVTG